MAPAPRNPAPDTLLPSETITTAAEEKGLKKILRVGLAPMEGITDLPTRMWYALTSRPDFATTPFLRVTQEYPYKRVPATYCPEISVLKGTLPFPVAPQLMGSSPDDLCRIAEPFLKLTDFIDLNCGCPAPKVVGHRAGSGLLVDPHGFVQFLMRMSQSLGGRGLAVKMRTGFDEDSEFPALLEAVAAVSPARLTVHGRTRRDRYQGSARWSLIEQAAQKVTNAPVIGSGDIVNHQSFMERLHTGLSLDGVIVGRGALRNPWIFTELRTGNSVFLPYAVLKLSLACFAMLQEMANTQVEKLFDLALAGCFLETCGTSIHRWQLTYERLTVALTGGKKDFSELNVGPGTLAKVKMLWNSLRSGLPPEFFGPETLRSRSAAEFFERLDGMYTLWLQANKKDTPLVEPEETTGAKSRDEVSHGEEHAELLLSLRHRPELDWMYAGGKEHDTRET